MSPFPIHWQEDHVLTLLQSSHCNRHSSVSLDRETRRVVFSGEGGRMLVLAFLRPFSSYLSSSARPPTAPVVDLGCCSSACRTRWEHAARCTLSQRKGTHSRAAATEEPVASGKKNTSTTTTRLGDAWAKKFFTVAVAV
ncbi:predicted protein [Plenodomus lingam JN3]|uniref:Predicted protein n=1 Tax=Leptosphaeria maculans (strain JN3 / isolate v23.1.3 / race Av1-4-5-6-7-8) TaxID=985895 RepID=E4ZSK0_LEPMJ|nr:predicted protein [Plenodomus lingam JN3]CBX94380.1 predicted protein [Plenodomus lingam JN3]